MFLYYIYFVCAYRYHGLILLTLQGLKSGFFMLVKVNRRLMPTPKSLNSKMRDFV